MKFVPHDYQKFAIEWILEHPVAAVFLDMGLGKTVITLSAIWELIFERFAVGRVLVIAPLRVARDTWTEEAAKWEHLAGLRVVSATGSAGERLAALAAGAEVTVINRENLPWLMEKTPYGKAWPWDMVVIDELSSFKNHTAMRFKALRAARPRMQRVVGLTGTPSVNGLGDLWAEFLILDQGARLGRFVTGFRDAYLLPDKRNGVRVFSWKAKPDAEERIYQRIGDVTMSMKAADHLAMPALLLNELYVSMDEAEKRKYKQMREDYVFPLSEGEPVTAFSAGALCGKLSQLANGAIYKEGGGGFEAFHSRKLDALEDLLEAAMGQPVLVAYWFRHDRARIEERLTTIGIPFSALDSAESIRRWNAGGLPVGLIHPAGAGHGLNLQHGGSRLVWFGLTWSLELYQQTNARLWRQGQSAETVVVTHILTRGTIDEEIMAALRRKEVSQERLITAVRAERERGGAF